MVEPCLPNCLYRQSPDVEAEIYDEELLLLLPDSFRAVSLNASASAIWHAFDRPSSIAAIARTVLEAFPKKDFETTSGDIQALLADLLRDGFVQRIE